MPRQRPHPQSGAGPALAGTLALLALTTAALFLLALTGDRSPAPSAVGPGAANALALAPDRLLEIGIARTPEVAARVERIRAIRFNRVPEPQISDSGELRRLARKDQSRPGVKRSMRRDEVQLRLLGLLGPDESLAQVASDYTALAAAYYDPRKRGLFLVGDAVPAGPGVTEFVLAHELTHALEDQVLGLPRSRAAGDDAALAEAALREGTATAVMEIYAARHLDPFSLLAEASSITTGDIELPAFAEAQVEFTYGTGAEFVNVLRRLANGWGLVDNAFTGRPPSTTEQIIHPEKYLAGESAESVAIPEGPGAGWSRIDTGTAGEWATRQLLSAGDPGLGATAAAAGWGGDSYAMFARRNARPTCNEQCHRDHAFALHWRYDTPAEAAELTAALRKYAEQLESGAKSVKRSGRMVGLAIGPSARLAARLASVAR